jgi:hypothetical protein
MCGSGFVHHYRFLYDLPTELAVCCTWLEYASLGECIMVEVLHHCCDYGCEFGLLLAAVCGVTAGKLGL